MLFHEERTTSHTARFGGETCVFDFWAWRSTFPEPTAENGACERFLTKRVRLVQDPAACDPAPRERSFLLEPRQVDGAEGRGGVGRSQSGDGLALNGTWQWWWWRGGKGQSPECKTTVHASFKQAHAPFIYKKHTLS